MLLLNGVPDDRRVYCMYSPERRGPTQVFPGAASFLPTAMRAIAGLQVALIGPGFALSLHPERRPAALINHIGDADECRQALELAVRLANDAALPCFNAPERVAATARDRVYQALRDVPGVHMPATIRISPRRPDDVIEAIEAAGLRYPVILRLPGDHGGRSMVRMDGPEDLDPLFSIPWGGRSLYATQFVDYADSDGFHRKVRLVVVGDRYFPRHRVRGRGWMVHIADRDPASLAEESAFLDGFDGSMRPLLDSAIAGIRQRIGLDYFGIDCSIRPDGRLLVFEVNPSMHILRNTSPSPNIWDAPIARIEEALVDLLREPARWVAQPGR